MDFTTTEENRKVYLSHIKRLEVECPGQVGVIYTVYIMTLIYYSICNNTNII